MWTLSPALRVVPRIARRYRARGLALLILSVLLLTVALPAGAADVDHWQQLRPGGRAAPPLRWGAAAYDPDGHRLFVFGGGSETLDDYNDLWALSLEAGKEAWALLKPYGTAPYFRRHAAAAYDEGNHRLVLFGGYNAAKGQFYDETWLVTELTAGDGRWLKHTGLPRPAPRRGTSLVYQSTEDAQGQPVQRMILFGGYSDDSVFRDVWAFDLTPGQERWRELTPCGTAPLARDGHVAVYDAARRRMILYGGWSRERDIVRTLGDTWELDLTPGRECWAQLQPGGTTISDLGWAVAGYDACPGAERMVVHGGYNQSRRLSSGDVWALALPGGAEAWSRRDQSGARPVPRDSHMGVFDPPGRRLIVYGGWDGQGTVLRDTWALEVQPCAVPTAPPPPTYTAEPTGLPTATETVPATATFTSEPPPTGAVTTTVPPTRPPTTAPPPTVTVTPPGGDCPDAYEPDDTWYQGKLLTPGMATDRTFGRPGDMDFAKFVATRGQPYSLRTQGLAANLDTRLHLYDTDGQTQLAWNDDDPANPPASRLDWTAPADGSYFAKVTNLDPTVGGCGATYQLALSLSTIPSATPAPTATRKPGPRPIHLPVAAKAAVLVAPRPTATPATASCDPGFELGTLADHVPGPRPLPPPPCEVMGPAPWRLSALGPVAARRLDPALRRLYDRLVAGAAPASGDGTGLATWAEALPGQVAPTRVTAWTPVRVLVTTSDPAGIAAVGGTIRARAGPVVAAMVPAGGLGSLAGQPAVTSVAAPAIYQPANDLGRADTRVPEAVDGYGLSSRGVLVGMIDTGVDVTHPSFIDASGRTRVLALLDLADPGDLDGDGDLDGSGPGGGTLYSQAEIDAAIQALRAGTARIHHWRQEPLEVPDDGQVVAELTVPPAESLTIIDLRLGVQLTHEWLDDLTLTLVAPDSSRHVLPRTQGATVYDYVATHAIAGLAGQSTAGTWKLEANDKDGEANEYGGDLVDWTLYVNSPVRHEDLDGHGTHVLGTAAGDDADVGAADFGRYAGAAPEADLLVVQGERDHDGFSEDDIVVGMAWLDQMAQSLGRPYVTNMSIVSILGPHDGSEPAGLAIDTLYGAGHPGKAAIVSAGNEGDNKIHAGGTLTPGSQAIGLAFGSGLEREYIEIWLDGTPPDQLGIVFPAGPGLACVTTNVDGEDQRDNCGRFPLRPGDPARMFHLYRGDEWVNYGMVTVSGPRSNGAYRITASFNPYVRSDGDTLLAGTWRVNLWGATGRWDAWTLYDETQPDGDNRMTVGSPGAARNAITVGAHITRIEYTDVDGQPHIDDAEVGDLVAFSSHGPTRDGRVTPHLTAPGARIISARSAASSRAAKYIVSARHLVLQGTSMAAPHVTGAVALLLAAPGGAALDASQIRDLLRTGARRDGFTGTDPEPNTWGAGKLDLLATLRAWGLPPVVTPTTPPTAPPTAPPPTVTSVPSIPPPTPVVTATPVPPPCWSRGGELPVRLVTALDDGGPVHAGRHAALLGDPARGAGLPGGSPVPIGSAWISQSLVVPDSGQASLRFWYRVVTYDVVSDPVRQGADYLGVEVNGERVFTAGNSTGALPGQRVEIGWREARVDLARWRGQRVTLTFANWNGAMRGPDAEWYNTWSYVDDVYVLP